MRMNRRQRRAAKKKGLDKPIARLEGKLERMEKAQQISDVDAEKRQDAFRRALISYSELLQTSARLEGAFISGTGEKLRSTLIEHSKNLIGALDKWRNTLGAIERDLGITVDLPELEKTNWYCKELWSLAGQYIDSNKDQRSAIQDRAITFLGKHGHGFKEWLPQIMGQIERPGPKPDELKRWIGEEILRRYGPESNHQELFAEILSDLREGNVDIDDEQILGCIRIMKKVAYEKRGDWARAQKHRAKKALGINSQRLSAGQPAKKHLISK